MYFARPDSRVFGEDVGAVRERLGEQLAREHPAGADIVVAVPDSGVPAALGFARESGLPLALGLVRNHYVGRTFIEPRQAIRHFGVKMKLNPVRSAVEGKRVVLVDDSIVRGTTSRKIVMMLKGAGATRGAPADLLAPDDRAVLLRHRHPGAARADRLQQERRGDPGLRRRRLPGLPLRAGHALVPDDAGPSNFCTACFSGNYRVLDEEDRADVVAKEER